MSEAQLSLSGAWERDEAIGRVLLAHKEWIEGVATAELWLVAKKHEFFTTDEVWAALGGYPGPSERRAMGALIRQFLLRGFIERTEVTVCSDRPECHRRPVRLWKSLIYEGKKS